MLPLTKRVDIELGYSCNARCSFCYYLRSIETGGPKKDLSTDRVKRLLRFIRQKGIEVVDFSGGEPTVRKDLIELITYAKGLGFRSIGIITNGIVLANMDYARRLAEAGVDDFLFSLHGPDAKTHDELTNVPGSFERIIKSIQNIKQLRTKCRTNTVVTSYNYNKVEAITQLLVELEIPIINFILFNPVYETRNVAKEMIINYAQAAPFFKRAIDNYALKITKLTIRYMPFCLMENYEKYLVNTAQRQYDLDEWDYLIRTQVRNGRLLTYIALGIGLFLLSRDLPMYTIDWNRIKQEGIRKFFEFKNKVKSLYCRECRYDKICDGVWKNYAKCNGFGKLKPITGGAKITDPTYFMRQ